MGDRAGDLDRWRPLHLLTTRRATCASWRTSSASRASAATRRAADDARARPSGSRRSSRFADGRVVETGGHPVVLGEWLGAPGAPTILVYGHYDVQPPGDEAEWETPPFEPSVRDGRIYARGATDDKGPVLVALKVAEAFLAQQRRAAAERPLSDRGRGGDRQPEPRRRSCAATATSSPPTSWSRPTARCGAPTEPSIAIAAKGLLALDLDRAPARAPTCTRAATAAPSRIRSTRSRSSLAGLHDAGRRGRGRRLLRRRRAARRADRAALARVPFDEEAYRARGRRAGPARRARLHDARAALDPADARGERRSRAAARSRSSRGAPRAHITCRLVPDQDPDAVFDGDRTRICAPRARRASR